MSSLDGIAQSRRWSALIDGHRKTVEQWRGELHELSKETAEYYRAKAKAEMKYRDLGYPSAMCADLAKGDADVSPHLERKTYLEGMVKADNEVIQTNKRQLDMARDEWSREWRESGRFDQ